VNSLESQSVPEPEIGTGAGVGSEGTLLQLMCCVLSISSSLDFRVTVGGQRCSILIQTYHEGPMLHEEKM
jgi:hypothetical protein